MKKIKYALLKMGHLHGKIEMEVFTPQIDVLVMEKNFDWVNALKEPHIDDMVGSSPMVKRLRFGLVKRISEFKARYEFEDII